MFAVCFPRCTLASRLEFDAIFDLRLFWNYVSLGLAMLGLHAGKKLLTAIVLKVSLDIQTSVLNGRIYGGMELPDSNATPTYLGAAYKGAVPSYSACRRTLSRASAQRAKQQRFGHPGIV